MSKYFTITAGLRGCYMPDSCYVARVDSRRELKQHIESAVNSYANSDSIDSEYRLRFNRRDIAAVAAAVWREAQKPRPAYLPHVVPMGPGLSRPHGVFVSVATRGEYLADNES